MTRGFQVMSGHSRATLGVYHAETPEAALDEWAIAYKWGRTWKEAQEKAPDLFGKGFRLEEGFRILLLSQ